ncbi:unnamed protein product [Pieris macdunnoughi]|uniref:omega-amidase n=1 Tax=Pieris macdunnoughi TaxID=345717 RepID=A0A821Y310_9NEOP|nr:unnamed protein product [Pieris macdunnoughi]
MHLFDIDIPNKITFKESEVLKPGNEITTFECNGVKIGLGICYDLRFQEIAHLMANEGCGLLIYPGAFNMTTGPKHWELLGRARATDQQLWVALVSPARDANAEYVAWGHTTLVDPWGAVAAKLDEKEDTLVHTVATSNVICYFKTITDKCDQVINVDLDTPDSKESQWINCRGPVITHFRRDRGRACRNQTENL